MTRIDRAQRELWRDGLLALGLTPGTTQFLQVGPASGLTDSGVLAAVVPPDPFATDLDFTDDLFSDVLPGRFTGLTANSVSLLNSRRRSTSTVFVEASNDGQRRAYMALHRSGGVEGGIGSATYTAGELQRIYRLYTLVHLARQVIETQTRLLTPERREVVGDGPFEIVILVPNARGASLGGYAEGWQPVETLWGDEIPVCLEDNPTVRLGVGEWPRDPERVSELVVRAATRISDMFGDDQRRFLAARGAAVGTLIPDYA